MEAVVTISLQTLDIVTILLHCYIIAFDGQGMELSQTSIHGPCLPAMPLIYILRYELVQ